MESIANPNLAILFGIVASMLTSLLKHPRWTSEAKFALSLGVAVAFGVLDVWLQVEAGEMEWTLSAIVERAAVVAVASQVYYRLLVKGPAATLDEKLASVGATPDAGHDGR